LRWQLPVRQKKYIGDEDLEITFCEPDFTNYTQSRRTHWDSVAMWMEGHTGWGEYYHRQLAHIYQLIVPPGLKVLELGCGSGDLLASLKPSRGVGVDFSVEMVNCAIRRHPRLEFIEADAHDFSSEETFDVIILSDLVDDLWDVQHLFAQTLKLCHSSTRVIINAYSRLWEWPLGLAQKLNLARPRLDQNWLTVQDISNLLKLANFEVIRSWTEILCPVAFPLLSELANCYLVKTLPFRWLGLTNFITARPLPTLLTAMRQPTVSVIVPARNEAGNISSIIARIPEMGRGSEIIFVEGHSSDNTYSVIQREISRHPEKSCRVFKQFGKGKGDAVRLGFAHAGGDILMILDADMTVPPEDLPRFFDALRSGKGEFINGVRLVYPVDRQSMRFFNLIGNKFFSLAFSWLLGQPIKDTLCGTKVLWKKDYEKISANRSHFGDFDPFGDFDLLFGAARLGLKIMDLPIRYRERTYGTSNIHRWRHGWLLLKMVIFAAKRIKFV
jgi:ubiquinone/menaquinone biosynthesis C-methylase UbiE